LGWVTSREARNRKLWRVTPKGRKAYSSNAAGERRQE
jgi:DNA-binding PadR family transcriptional regulator